MDIHPLYMVLWFALADFSHSLQVQSMTLQQCIETALSNNKNLQVGRIYLGLNEHPARAMFPNHSLFVFVAAGSIFIKFGGTNSK